MKVNTTNWPDICNVVINSSRTISRLRPTSAHVLRSTGAPISPPGRRHASNRATDAADHADAAIGRAPAMAARDQGDQRQADRRGQRPSEKDIGDGAAALFRRHDQGGGAGGLRRIERADRQHDQANGEQARIVGRERRGGIAEREDRQRRREQRAALDPAGQPRRHRRTDAQHDRAEGNQKTGVADRDAETPTTIRSACPPAPAPSSR